MMPARAPRKPPGRVTPRSVLQTIWLVRVPVLSLVALWVLGTVATGRLNSVLVGLFNLEGDQLGMLLVATTAFLNAAACLTAINMALHLGTARFDIPGLADPSPRFQLFVFVAANVFPILLLQSVYKLTPGNSIAKSFIAVSGFCLAALIVFVAKVLQMKWTDPGRTKHPPPYLVFPASV